MKIVKQVLTAKGSNWAVCLLSASLMAVAASNWTRPAPVSAQAGGVTRMTGESKAVLNALENAFVNIAENVEPSVVTISARVNVPEKSAAPMQEKPDERNIPEQFRDLFRRGPDTPRPSTGSGVIIRENGTTVYVLTNNHVVDNRDRLRITLSNKTEYVGELVGRDQRTDLAVLKFQVKSPLPAGSVARVGNSDLVKPGHWAIAIGSPLGYESTLTVGVISAKGRELRGLGAGTTNYVDLIQTDASINPGNSGGALVNIDGEVIGINTAIASSGMSQGNIGIGFAIPVNTAKMVSEQLIARGKVVRGYLGVSCSSANRDLSPELREHLACPDGGALTEGVSPDGPAGRAGMKEGDVIVKFGDRVIRSFTDLENAVAATAPGATVPVEVMRNGKRERLSLTVKERPSEEELLKGAAPAEPKPAPKEPTGVQPVKSKFGLSIRPVDGGQGVEIVSVAPGSPAEEAGLDRGYVIIEVARTATPTVEAFQKAINGVPANSAVVLRVSTPAGMRLVVLKP
jgi:serine protease Do